jgi:enoyl-CoA hydratase/carnithine racemase
MVSETTSLTPSPSLVPNPLPRAALALANVQYEKKSSIAYVTVNRPKVLNALNTPTWTDLRAAFEDAKADASVHGVILTGDGDKAFIAGADISELANVDAYEGEESSRFGQGVLDMIEDLGKPVIAAINGFALGGGCETAMACTMRIAAEHANFGQPGVKLGLLPGGGGTQRLPRLVGKGRALQLILTGETISAQEAFRIGLVNEVVPAGDLVARAETILGQIMANGPIAVNSLEAANKGMDTATSSTRATARNSRCPFLEKRKPDFARSIKSPAIT